MRRARLRAANDMEMIRRAPMMRVAFDAMRANAAANAPRSRALVETCEMFVSVSARRARRACLRAWRDAAREGALEKTCAAIHNVRCVHAAIRHWELFVARAFWKRTANELATRYARGRLRVQTFCAWLLHLRRAKERRIAVRARMFGMSVPEAQRAVHEKLDRTARDAARMREKELVFLFEEQCLRSALRSQVAAGAKLARTLAGLRRFSADESDVEWATSAAAALHGVSSARRHIEAGFSTRGTKPISSVRRAALSRDREDVAASRTVAAIEDENEASMDDDALIAAEAFERAREHEAALSAAREATKRCMDARKFAQDVSLRANRLVANSDSRANAAFQGAQDAMNESARAEYLAMEAEVEADAAEERANTLSRTLGAEHPEVSEAFRRAADAATRAVTLSSAHVAAARVAERALDIAEEHKRAADLIKAQASDDVEAARSRVLEAEATLMAMAKAERELKMEAMRATASFRHATGNAPKNVGPSEEGASNAVFSPKKRRSAEEKQIARRRLTWASFGDDDDDDDDTMQLRSVSLVPGKWVTLAECATQAYAKRLAFKSLRGFAENVDWRRRQRAAALLALVTKAFTTWAELARVNQSRRKLVESVVDEVLGEDRARRLLVYMTVLQKHAKWRRARCDELRLSLRRVVAPTIMRPAFDHWRAKVGRILLVRRVINRGIAAWKARGNRPSHANAFYRMYDAFAAWKALARVKRERRRRTAAAREYHRVAVALRVMQEWRRVSHRGRARARDLDVDLEEFRIRCRLRAKRSAFFRWRAETLRRRIRALSLEHSRQMFTATRGAPSPSPLRGRIADR